MAEASSTTSPSNARPRIRLSQREQLVDRRFQLKYAGMMAVAALIGSALGGIIMAVAFNNALYVSPLAMELNPEQQRAAMTLILGMGLVVATVMGCVGIYLTQRVAGPVRALAEMVRQFAGSLRPPVRKLRAGDEFEPFFFAVRADLESIAHRRNAEREELRQLVDQLSLNSTAENEHILAKIRDLTASLPPAGK